MGSMARSIEEVLKEVRIEEVKLEPAITVAGDTSLEEIYRLLEASPHGAIVVLEDTRIVGIFTERDVLYRTALEDLDPDTPIEELMTPDPTTIAVSERLAAAVRVMTERGYRHVPLVDGEDRYLGLLASRDVLGFIADHFPEAVLNLPPHLHQKMLTPEGG